MRSKQHKIMRRAVFLDKDGTLIPDIAYNVDPAQISLLPGVAEGLRRLRARGYMLIIISNQAGLGLGHFTEAQYNHALKRLEELLDEEGVAIDGVYFCPHHPDATLPEYRQVCNCRKPETGLLVQAAREHHIDLAGSWMIGDILNDVEAGNRVGCRSILIDNGGETEWLSGAYRKPAFVCTAVNLAADYIVRHESVDE